jgi:MerR family transcriptional regulator, light-induced transcriptional regulator
LPETRISLQEAADRLGVHYMTAYRYVRTGRLPARREGSQWWVDPRDLGAVARSAGRAGRPAGAVRPSRAAEVRRLEKRLVAGDEPGAWSIVEASLGAGAEPDDVLVDLLGAAMSSVGNRWEAGDYTVDDEHRATAVASRLVARLGPRFNRRGPKRRPVVLGTPPGELHGLPTAIAANLLRGRGFEVIDLGADVPADAFARAAEKATRPLAVAVAVTTGNHDRSLRAIARALKEAVPGLPFVLGGATVRDADHAARLGATWSGREARSLAAVMEELDALPPR